MADELSELQREWRESVTLSLKELRNQNARLFDELHTLQNKFALSASLQDVKKRVSNLEADRSKMVGALVVLQVIGAAVFWIISKFK